MTDNVATRTRHNVADPLREYAAPLGWGTRDVLLAIADEIDAEHERRMRQQHGSMRRKRRMHKPRKERE